MDVVPLNCKEGVLLTGCEASVAPIGQAAEQASQYVQHVLEDNEEHCSSVDISFTLVRAPVSNVLHDVIRAQSQDNEVGKQQDQEDQLHHTDAMCTAGGAPVHSETPSVPPTCEGGANGSKHGLQSIQGTPANQVQDYHTVCALVVTGYTWREEERRRYRGNSTSVKQ